MPRWVAHALTFFCSEGLDWPTGRGLLRNACQPWPVEGSVATALDSICSSHASPCAPAACPVLLQAVEAWVELIPGEVLGGGADVHMQVLPGTQFVVEPFVTAEPLQVGGMAGWMRLCVRLAHAKPMLACVPACLHACSLSLAVLHLAWR